jgi:hypothetical protein
MTSGTSDCWICSWVAFPPKLERIVRVEADEIVLGLLFDGRQVRDLPRGDVVLKGWPRAIQRPY